MSNRRRMDRNILVISDLHLGEDLRPNPTAVSYLRRIARLERELESFLAHYTQNRLDGRPWRLVINGDMVDFMSVMILPHQGGEAATDDERRFGLAHEERQSMEKLDRVVERHQGVFRRLAEFVAADNELVIVVGNHDVEFYFQEVQRRFIDRLVLLSEGVARERIRFCPWFYYEEELVYVEHGHQYDEYCSFDYQLHPVETRGNVALSIAHSGIRYFTNMVPTMDPHVGEQWGFIDYMKWAWGQGARGMARLCYWYGLMIWKIMEVWSRLRDPRAEEARGGLHRARLKALAADYRITVEKVEALDKLHSVPVSKRLFKILSALFIDRIALGFLTMVALVVCLVVAPGTWKLAAAGGLLTASATANFLLGRGRLIPSEISLRRTPEMIGRILAAPFIVFGHSHRAESVKLASGGVYFNTGAWANDDLGLAFTHLIISGDEPHAELRQWRDGASAPFEVA